MYRIVPSASHGSFEPIQSRERLDLSFNFIPDQLRWDPFDVNPGVDWVKGLNLVAGAGDPALKNGVAYYVSFDG